MTPATGTVSRVKLKLQRLPVDLNQDGLRGSGEAFWH
jgi:hypothetical protein